MNAAANGPILHVIDRLGAGGAERLLLAYAPRLRDFGRDVRVIVLSVCDGNPYAEALQREGISVELVPVTKLRHLGECAALARRLRTLRPSVVHAHLDFATLLCAGMRGVHGGAVVATMHTVDIRPLMSRAGVRQRLMFAIADRMSDRLICLSSFGADGLRRNGVSRAPIEIIANGIEVERFRPPASGERQALRRAMGYGDDDFVVLSVAVLRPQKGLDRLVAAFEGIRATAPQARLLIVGDGPELAALQAQRTALGLDDIVTFAGHRADIPQIMALSDLFVLPTLGDAQPTVVMEAMAAELPVVASAVDGLPDMIADGVDGALTPPGDVASLRSAVLRLITDPERRAKFRSAGRATVEARFSLDRQARMIDALYDRLIAERLMKTARPGG